MAAAANEEVRVEQESRQIENRRTREEDVIALEVKHEVTELDRTELSTMIEEWLEEILWKSFHNVQSCIQSVIYNVVEQDMLNLLRKDVIKETIDAHIAKFFD